MQLCTSQLGRVPIVEAYRITLQFSSQGMTPEGRLSCLDPPTALGAHQAKTIEAQGSEKVPPGKGDFQSMKTSPCQAKWQDPSVMLGLVRGGHSPRPPQVAAA